MNARSALVDLELPILRGALLAGLAVGRLASGKKGLGRPVEPIELAPSVRSVMGCSRGDLRRRQIIVTAVADVRPAEAPESKPKKQDTEREGMTIELCLDLDVIALMEASELLKLGLAARRTN